MLDFLIAIGFVVVLLGSVVLLLKQKRSKKEA